MSLTIEGQRMVKRGEIIGLEADLAQAESFVKTYEDRNSDFWADNVTAWREARAKAWVALEVAKMELADFEARH